MSEKKIVKPIALAVGAALVGSFALSSSIASADTVESPFAMSTLTAGYMLSAGEGSCGGDKDQKEGEATCGGDKEGEASCGGDKEGEATCGADKEGEATCGADKEGEASCGGDKEEAEGSCGEGSCGADKEG
jgi:hypothetical protein